MGIKKNVLYTSILTTSNYIFPLVVYPYVARVLGVTNIGLCNFIDNVINYFIFFSMMGINIMGNRQIAMDKARGNSLDKSFSSLISLNALSTFISLGCLIGAIYIIPTLHENKELMWFGAIKLVSNLFLIEWFYKGIEDFRYITMRTILVKCLYVASIFIFIHQRADYPIYYLLTVLMVTFNAIINTWHSARFTRFRIKLISFANIFKPFLMLGIYMLVTSLCTTFNVVYLGFATDDTQVGYYTTATKLYAILLAFFTGVTSVVMPRMSNLLATGKIDEFKEIMAKTTNLLFSFTIPVIILADIFAPQIIMLLSGPGYEGAITPMRIVMPLMLVIGYNQIMVIQTLMPLKADKGIMINSSIAAVVSITLNIVLVHSLKSIGSSIAWISSETVLLCLSQILVKKLTSVKFPFQKLFKVILGNIFLCGLLLMIYFLSSERLYWLFLLVGGIVTAIYTFILQVLIYRNPMMLNLLQSLRQKIQPSLKG